MLTTGYSNCGMCLFDSCVAVINSLRPRQNGRHFADDIFQCIFVNENVWISMKISLKFVLKGPISNIPALVQIMDWRRPGDKPLSEPMMVSLLTHICVTRPQWVNLFPSSVPYMRRWNGSSLFQEMTCRLFGTEPLSETMLVCCQLDSWKQFFSKVCFGRNFI